jgi:hypothetical protein
MQRPALRRDQVVIHDQLDVDDWRERSRPAHARGAATAAPLAPGQLVLNRAADAPASR